MLLAVMLKLHHKRPGDGKYERKDLPLILDEKEQLGIYRFWTHFFSQADLSSILTHPGFGNLSFHEDVLPGGDLWNGEHVIFCKSII